MMWYRWNVSHSRRPAARFENGVFVHTTAVNSPVGLSWGSYCRPAWCIHQSWDRSGGGCVSSCVIVFSACVRPCQCVIISEWKIFYQFSPLSFARVTNIYIKNDCLSQRETGRGKREPCSSDLTCSAGVFETPVAIKLFVLNCPVNRNHIIFQGRIHHLVLV